MTSQSKYLGDLRTENVHIKSKAKLLTDAPVDNHGKSEAFSPTDLVATALANCMLTMMGIVAEKHGINIKHATAETEKFMEKNPRRISKINVHIKLPENLTEKDRKLLEKTAVTCPVHYSLNKDIEKNVRFSYVEIASEKE